MNEGTLVDPWASWRRFAAAEPSTSCESTRNRHFDFTGDVEGLRTMVEVEHLRAAAASYGVNEGPEGGI